MVEEPVWELNIRLENYIMVMDGDPCNHPGCRCHLTHPCEVCHRIGCKGNSYYKLDV